MGYARKPAAYRAAPGISASRIAIVAVLQLFYRGGLWCLEMTLLVKVSFTLTIVANFQNGDQINIIKYKNFSFRGLRLKKLHYVRLSRQYIYLRARIDF